MNNYNQETEQMAALIESGLDRGLSYNEARMEARTALNAWRDLERQRIAAETLRNAQRAYDYNARARRHNSIHPGRPAPIISTYRTNLRKRAADFEHRDNVVRFNPRGAVMSSEKWRISAATPDQLARMELDKRRESVTLLTGQLLAGAFIDDAARKRAVGTIRNLQALVAEAELELKIGEAAA